MGVGVAALVAQCAGSPSTMSAIVWQPWKGRTWGCLPVDGQCSVPVRLFQGVLPGLCPGARGIGGHWWGCIKWQGCPKGQQPCTKLRDPFLVSLACLIA